METNPQALPKTTGVGFTPAIRPLIFAVIACAVVVVLFSPAGFIYKHADLSFLVLPFISYYILRFMARLSSIYLPIHSSIQTAATASSICNGLAFSLFFFFFLSNAEMLTSVSPFNHMKGFLTDLAATAGYVVLFICGVTICKLAGITRETDSGKAYYPIINAVGQFFIGISIWQCLAAFSSPTGVLYKIGLMAFAGMITVAVSNAGQYGKDSKNPFMADASHWLIHSGAAEFVIGAFIAAYILFIRPFVMDIFNYAAIGEWLVVCLLGWRLFSGIKNGIRVRCAVDVHEAEWKKHILQVNIQQGTEFPQLGAIQEIFIQDGGRDALLIYLTLLLHNNKISPDEIQRILHPLINYQDARMPWFAFGWEQQRILKQNETNRRLILGEIMTNLKYIMNPSNQNIEEHTNEENQPG